MTAFLLILAGFALLFSVLLAFGVAQIPIWAPIILVAGVVLIQLIMQTVPRR